MSHYRKRHLSKNWNEFPPSEPCSCEVCLTYCSRPGWWTVSEATRAMQGGYAKHMMLELSPDRTFGVLSPAFKGCEGFFALNEFSQNGCTFLEHERCQLHGTDFQPLECRFCHHSRIGLGRKCHAALERDWNSRDGQTLVLTWLKIRDLQHFLQRGQLQHLEEKAGKTHSKR